LGDKHEKATLGQALIPLWGLNRGRKHAEGFSGTRKGEGKARRKGHSGRKKIWEGERKLSLTKNV